MWNPFARTPKADETTLAVATFVIGIGVMAIEITASRLLAPYFGASMFVWTSLIVTVLVALSAGYFIGGKAAAKGLGVEAVGFLSCGAAILLVAGLLVIPSFSSAITGVLIGLSSASVALFAGSLVVTMIVFAAPVFLLAMSGPILMKAWSALGDVGTIAGRYFAVSTIGSVIGTVAPTLVLVPTLGARNTIFIVAAMFILLGIALVPGWRRIMAGLGLALALGSQLLPSKVPDDVVMERESPYQLIRVAVKGDTRYLIFNEGSGVQSVYEPDGGRTGFYYDFMSIVPLIRPIDGGHRALIVGLAGGTVATRYRAFLDGDDDVDLTGVEVDSAVIDTARRWFALDEAGTRVVNEDGRTYLSAVDESFDAIIVDAYSTQLYIPPHLATKEYFSLAKSKLSPGGVFVMNVNAPDADSRLLKALTNTTAAVFPHVRVMPITEAWNNLVIASDRPFDLDEVARKIPPGYDDVRLSLRGSRAVAYDPGEEVFTDDRAPVEFLTDSMILAQLVRKE